MKNYTGTYTANFFRARLPNLTEFPKLPNILGQNRQMSIIGETLHNRQLPSKQRIIDAAKNKAKDFIINPIRTIKDGIEKDRQAVELYRQYTGVQNPRLEMLKHSLTGIYKGGGKDLAVNTGGLAGSLIGGQVGKIGALAGDYTGAAITRRALDDTEALINATKYMSSPRFKNLPNSQKAEIVRRRAGRYLNRNKKDIKSEYHKDGIGWGIGNSAAESLDNMNVDIPLKGAAVAIGTVPSVYKGAKVAAKVGKSRTALDAARLGVVSTARDLKKNFNLKRKVKQGLQREQVMTDSVNNQLQNMPVLPKEFIFKKHFTYMCDF